MEGNGRAELVRDMLWEWVDVADAFDSHLHILQRQGGIP